MFKSDYSLISQIRLKFTHFVNCRVYSSVKWLPPQRLSYNEVRNPLNGRMESIWWWRGWSEIQVSSATPYCWKINYFWQWCTPSTRWLASGFWLGKMSECTNFSESSHTLKILRQSYLPSYTLYCDGKYRYHINFSIPSCTLGVLISAPNDVIQSHNLLYIIILWQMTCLTWRF